MITVQTTVNAPLKTVWTCWTEPAHITGWAFASDDWECPNAENDLSVGGSFTTTMGAKDGSVSFDIVGTYTELEENVHIAYTMADGRRVIVDFEETADCVHIAQQFDPEQENPHEMQQAGWQAILDNFKKYTEAQ